MIAIKKALYMTVPLLTAMTSCVQANDDTSSGTFTIGLGGHYTPRYQFDAHWGTLLSADYTWLGEHANESPIVLRRNEAALTAAVIWTF